MRCDIPPEKFYTNLSYSNSAQDGFNRLNGSTDYWEKIKTFI
jgi:hypothetical protein